MLFINGDLKMAEFKKEYTIQNVVASADLHGNVPLEKVSRTLPNTEYNPEQFPGLVLKIPEKKITSLVFSTGKIVCTGTKSEEQVERAINAIKKELLKVKGIKFEGKPEYEIQNVVASGDIGVRLNLVDLAFKLKTAEYEPEQFPGLVYKVPESHITFLLFGTGKIVCTGAKNEKEISKAIDELIVTIKGVM